MLTYYRGDRRSCNGSDPLLLVRPQISSVALWVKDAAYLAPRPKLDNKIQAQTNSMGPKPRLTLRKNPSRYNFYRPNSSYYIDFTEKKYA